MRLGSPTADTTSTAVRRAATAARYGGTRYRCPICGGRFRRLGPGPDGRTHATCPQCGSMERHRLAWLYLDRELGVTRRALRVLHVAPERGVERRLRAQPDITYTSTDLGDLEATVQADLTDLPFADASFDLALCSHVLEHVVDDAAAMRELHRVLAPGGVAVLQHPIDLARPVTYEDATITDPAAREAAFLQRDHVRIYGQDFDERLRTAGFTVEVVDYEEHLTARERARFRTTTAAGQGRASTIRGDRLHVCRVPAAS